MMVYGRPAPALFAWHGDSYEFAGDESDPNSKGQLIYFPIAEKHRLNANTRPWGNCRRKGTGPTGATRRRRIEQSNPERIKISNIFLLQRCNQPSFKTAATESTIRSCA